MLSKFAVQAAKTFALGVASLSVLAAAPGAKAGILNFYIFNDPANSNNASVKILGAIDSPASASNPSTACTTAGSGDLVLDSTLGVQYINICAVKFSAAFQGYYPLIVSPASFPTPFSAVLSGFSNGLITGNPDVFIEAQPSSSGLSSLYLTNSYTTGSNIDTTINFASPLSAASPGPIVGNGLIGTFSIGTVDTVNVYLDAPPSPPPTPSGVPAPLPILGASAAFGWARRMRVRLAAAA